MAAYSRSPIYNLKAVLKETGLKPDLLRAWERRYGLPNPGRTEGGHRLYSDHDVALLKWLMQQQEDGLSISRAAKLWQDSVVAGKDLLDATHAKLAPSAQATYIGQQPENHLDEIRNAWLGAALAFNEIQAEQELSQAFAIYPIEMVCLNVLQRGIAEVGMLWHEGKVTVQQEHYISAMAHRRVDSLLLATPAPTRPQTIIVGCPPYEWHAFTPLLLTLFLRRKGYNVIYLGPNVPSNRFADLLVQIHPALLILAAQRLTTAAELSSLTSQLAHTGTIVAFGGRIFNMLPNLRDCIHGIFLGESLEEALACVDRLAVTPQPVVTTPCKPSAEYAAALEEFLANRTQVEARLTQSLKRYSKMDQDYMVQSNQFTGDTIVAALILGNLDYMNLEIEWLKPLLRSHNLPLDLIPKYFGEYANALKAVIPTGSAPILEWMDKAAA